jgi:NAD(P)-dependent dehydrogenase (short-subunit alcohol dehydrogenase family)
VRIFDLQGKVALVTGAGRGLGRGMAIALAEAGADVVAVSRSADQLEETMTLLRRHGGSPRAMPWDLGDPYRLDDLVEKVAEHKGQVDVLLHAAGVQVRKPALEVTVDDWETVQAIHLRAAFFLSRAVARRMIERNAGGKIILVASLTSQIGVPNVAPYAAGKSGILGLVRTLAVEWAPHSIQVNALGPGYFRTAITEEIFADPERRSKLLARIPAGRPGEPEDLAGATVFLASPASDYMTGQVINVDGGWLAG